MPPKFFIDGSRPANKPITPNTLTRALGTDANLLNKAGDYSFSTQTKVIGFLTFGIGFVVALVFKHMNGGAAENKTRAFAHTLPKIYEHLLFAQENNGDKMASPITLDDGTSITFHEAAAADGKKVIITVSTAGGEQQEEIKHMSFDKLLKKLTAILPRIKTRIINISLLMMLIVFLSSWISTNTVKMHRGISFVKMGKPIVRLMKFCHVPTECQA